MKAKPMFGAFKQTIFSYIDYQAIWNSTSSSVTIKQCFYNLVSTGARVLYDKHSQLKKLTTEFNCLRWASALMGIVYSFINEYKTTSGLTSDSFPIPEMVYVKSTLTIAETDQEVSLLEEVIDDAVKGPFIKYIGNGSVQPFDFLTSEELC